MLTSLGRCGYSVFSLTDSGCHDDGGDDGDSVDSDDD